MQASQFPPPPSHLVPCCMIYENVDFFPRTHLASMDVVYGLWEIKMMMMLQQQTKSLCNIWNNFNVFSMPSYNSWSRELSYSTLLKWVVFSWHCITPDLSCLLLTDYNTWLPWVYITRQNITAGNIYLS